MMKEQFQIEEISKAIDAMNSKKPFHPADDEVRELMNTAMHIKQYGCTAEETAIVNQLAKQISSDITTRRRRKRLLSAVAGVAAAALLFAGVSFQMPPEIAQEQSKESIQSSRQVAVAENPNATVTRDNNRIIESLPANSSQPTPRIARSVKPDELPHSTKASSTPEVKKNLEVKEQPRVIAEAPKPGNAVLMILPDRSADSVSTEASGTVRQVYGKNTAKEIIVTQRSKNRATDTEAKSDLSAAPSVASQTRTTAAALNKATRNINGIEVVVEGKQTQAELEKVADSLVPEAETDTKRKENSP